jgi:Tol biopolymer transport system component
MPRLTPIALALLVLVLAACGGEDERAESKQTARVVDPADTGVIVFTGGIGDGAVAHAIRRNGTGLRPLQLAEQCEEPIEFSPDGRTALCWQYHGAGGRARLYVVHLNGSEVQHVRLPAGESMWPALSPDGSEFVFLHARDGEADAYELWKARSDGDGARRLVAGDTGPADWSPDGKRLAFVRISGDSDCGGDLVVTDAEGGQQRVVAKRSSVPQWSRDGTRVAFLGGSCEKPGIWTVPSDGGKPTLVARDAFVAHTFAWSLDSKSIAFVRAAKALGWGWSVRIFVAPASGGKPRAIGPLVADSPAEVFWLPSSVSPVPAR